MLMLVIKGSPSPGPAGGIAGFSLTPHQALGALAFLVVLYLIHKARKRRRSRRQAQTRNARSYSYGYRN